VIDPWNICPACNEHTDVSEDGQPGERFDCSECAEPLVAECFGEGDGVEWQLMTAADYDKESP
jgi:peptide subunit release factor 1 (eRF1)